MEEFMYRVIEMYGDCEPWWFLEGWEDDIVSSRKFEDYYPVSYTHLDVYKRQYEYRSGYGTSPWYGSS